MQILWLDSDTHHELFRAIIRIYAYDISLINSMLDKAKPNIHKINEGNKDMISYDINLKQNIVIPKTILCILSDFKYTCEVFSQLKIESTSINK